MNKMKRRFTFFMIVSISLMIICFYYVLCFYFTYPNSIEGWIKGIYIGMIMDYMGIKLVVPLVKIILRLIIRETNSKIIIKLNTLWITIMAYMKPKRI